MSRLLKILIYLTGSILLILGGIYVYLFHFGGLEQLTNNRLSRMIEGKYDLDVIIGDIEGDLLNGLTIRNINIFYDDSTSRYRLMHIPKASAAYSLSNLWNQDYRFNYLRLDSVQVVIVQDSTGRWLLPGFSSGTGATVASIPVFVVDEFSVDNTTILRIRGSDTTAIENVALALALEGGDNTYSGRIERFNLEINDKQHRFGATGGQLTFYDRGLVFKDLSAMVNDARGKISGSVTFDQTPSGQIDFAIDDIDLTNLTTLAGPKLKGQLDLNGSLEFEGLKLEGSVDIAGKLFFAVFQNLYVDFGFSEGLLNLDTLYGSILDGCMIDGSGFIDFSPSQKEYVIDADISGFNLSQLISGSFDSDLNGHFVLNGRSLKKKEMLLALAVDLHESSFDEYPLHEATGNMTITSEFIRFEDGFRIDYYENSFVTQGVIEYKDSIDLQVVGHLSNLDRYRGKLFIDQPGGRGYTRATLSGKTSQPDLKGYFVSDSVWIYGLFCDSLYSTVDIKRFLTGKEGTVEIWYYDGHAWPFPYDTGYAFLRVDSDLVFIDTAYLHNQHANICSRGMLDYGRWPYRMLLDTLALQMFNRNFNNQSSIVFDVDSIGFDFKQLALAGGETFLSTKGRMNFDESMELMLELKDVDLVPWIKLFRDDIPIGGIMSCSTRVGGTYLNPAIHLDGSVDSLTYRELVLGDLTACLSYRDTLLEIDSLMVLSHPGEYYATGYFPVNLAFTTDEIDRLVNRPMDIRARMTDNRFDLVSLILPSVERLEGNMQSSFRLSGTADDPHLEGQALLHNAELKYFDLEHPVFMDSAKVRMQDNRIIAERIEAYTTRNRKREGTRRYAIIDGEIIVKSLDNFYYDVYVDLPREFPFSYELEDISGVIEGELHVGGETPPLVTGDLALLSTRYLVNFAEPNEGSPIMMALSGENTWDLNINIEILSNYWIKNDDIDAEFSGEVNLLREDGKYRFIGEMEILRGRGYLFDKTFRLDPGGLVTFEGQERFNPRLDIVGYTRVSGISSGSELDQSDTPEQMELGVHITGTLDTVDIAPVEGSSFSREDILPLIVANYYATDTSSATGQLEGRFAGLVSSQVSQIGTHQLNQLGVGVETFEIEPLYGQEIDPLKARITVGFYTTPGLYVYGRSRLSGQTGQEVGFEYRINKTFMVEGRRDEDELYHLNLKLHWEY